MRIIISGIIGMAMIIAITSVFFLWEEYKRRNNES
jgi:hypothetical protein